MPREMPIRKLTTMKLAPNYFKTVGIPLLLGRDIGPQDTETSPRVAVINETMAGSTSGGTNPIGKKLGFEQQPVEIVGVARDARDHELRGAVRPRFYVPATQLSAPNPGR